MRIILALTALCVVMLGCGTSEQAHPSLDPSSAIVDPSKIHPVTRDMELKAGEQEGRPLPDFELPTTTGLTTTVKKLADGKPALLYFIQKRCPCCVEAEPFFTQLSAAFKGNVVCVGIINGSRAEAQEWAKVNTFDWPIFCDELGANIKKLGVPTGVYSMVINSSGTVSRVFPGYSADSLKEMVDVLSREAKVEAPVVEFKSAPKKLTTGCTFD